MECHINLTSSFSNSVLELVIVETASRYRIITTAHFKFQPLENQKSSRSNFLIICSQAMPWDVADTEFIFLNKQDRNFTYYCSLQFPYCSLAHWIKHVTILAISTCHFLCVHPFQVTTNILTPAWLPLGVTERFPRIISFAFCHCLNRFLLFNDA